MKNSLFRSVPAALIVVSLSAACASSPAKRGGERGGPMNELSGRSVAAPMALVLTSITPSETGSFMRADVTIGAGQMFEAFDRDKSGEMSRSEHADWARAALGDPYGRPSWISLDMDGSGSVSRSEFVIAFDEAADRYDANKDGTISRDELLIEIPERSVRGRGDAAPASPDGDPGRPRPRRS